MQRRLNHGPMNAKYTSPDIQNEVLGVMAGLIQEKICDGVRRAGYYSILADETKDCGKVEQLAVVLKYADIHTATQHEHFKTYVEAKAESLSAYIIETLHHHKLHPSKIVSQGYDGAFVMSGNVSGVQQRIREHAPMAVCIHCYTHCLNLVLVDSTKLVPEASEFFTLLELLYVFMSASKTHTIYTNQQTILQPHSPVRQLERLCDTRWACRFDAVDAISSTFGAILSSLQVIMHGRDTAKATEAKGIYAQINSFKFLTTLILFRRVLMCTKAYLISFKAHRLT